MTFHWFKLAGWILDKHLVTQIVPPQDMPRRASACENFAIGGLLTPNKPQDAKLTNGRCSIR